MLAPEVHHPELTAPCAKDGLMTLQGYCSIAGRMRDGYSLELE